MNAVVDFRREAAANVPAKPEAQPYLDAFATRVRAAEREPDWLTEQRRRSLQRFVELGFPSRKSESWRYLDLHRLEQRPLLPLAAAGRLDRRLRARRAELALSDACFRLVLVDGRFAAELSDIAPVPGVWFGAMSVALAERPDLVRAALEDVAAAAERPFAALNAAFFADGFALEIAPGTVLERPIEILHLASGAAEGAFHTRSLVALGAGSRAAIVETYAGPARRAERYWRNDVAVLRLAGTAELLRVALVEEEAAAVHLGDVAAQLGPGSRLALFAMLLGGGTVRHEASVAVAGEDARCMLDGAFAIAGREEANIVTTIDHQASGGETRELVKGVAAGHAHGAFQGRITVRAGTRKVDAQQVSRNLVIGARAVIDTKPELEIYADDVKCSHGASVGDLDEAALFYLRARGIAPDEARRLLIEGFLRDAVERIEDPILRPHLLAHLARRLASLEESE